MAAALALALTGCSSTSTSTSTPAPMSDEEKTKELYLEFRDAARASDAEAMERLTCEQFRAAVAAHDGWIKDAAQMGDFVGFEHLTAPKGGEGADAAVSAWGRVQFEGGGLQVAQVDGKWLACER